VTARKYHHIEQLLERNTNVGTAPRALIMAGGPGAGKSYVARRILSGTDAKWLDVDQITEFLARKAGRDLTDHTTGDELMPIAREKNQKRRALLADSGADLLIDGTGRHFESVVSLNGLRSC
jgi:predicted kinase